MATVTGLTADRMLAIEAASVIDGDVIGDHLVLTKKDGSQIDAGNVRGPQGAPGPVSSDLAVGIALPVLDIGMLGQIRAGRQLTAADFTNMGLSAPAGLWNLSDLTDASGNGRALSNKGAVLFDVGINGIASTSAKFVGSAAQALYLPDVGANDPFKIKTGSWGCWSRTAKRGTGQIAISKAKSNEIMFYMSIEASNFPGAFMSPNGTNVVGGVGLTDVADDRWHHIVATCDGTALRLYVDGVMEISTAISGPIFAGNGALNIGAYLADAASAGAAPHYGRVDEAFVTADVLSENAIRNLYCSKIAHTLGSTPTRVTLNVRRRRQQSAFVLADFPAAPSRLYNFSAGSLGDEGSNNTALAWNGTPQKTLSSVDGTPSNAYFMDGNGHLGASDAGLPAGLATRSYGCWLKTTSQAAAINIMSWGQSPGVNDTRLAVFTGVLNAQSGTDGAPGVFVSDGLWHFVTVVEDNGALDGVKRKVYVDGRLVGQSTAMVATVLGGANFFRVGASSTGGFPFVGQIDSAFVTNSALTLEQILALYLKGTQTLAPSPKNVGDHVEAVSATDILATFDTLPDRAQVDLGVAA